MVTNGTLRASCRLPEPAPSRFAGPPAATFSASSCTAIGKSSGTSNSARIRRNASRNGGNSAGARTTVLAISGVGVSPPRLDPSHAGGIGVVRADERDGLEWVVAGEDEVSPAEGRRLLPRSGHELRVLFFEEAPAQEHHRAAHRVERETVLGGVGEDLLLGPGPTGGVHHTRSSDRQEPVLADAVGEVLGDVRRE